MKIRPEESAMIHADGRMDMKELAELHAAAEKLLKTDGTVILCLNLNTFDTLWDLRTLKVHDLIHKSPPLVPVLSLPILFLLDSV
jgi:hypothetical protein